MGYVIDTYHVPWRSRRHRLVFWLARKLGVAIVPKGLYDMLWDSHERAVADRTKFKYAARRA